LAKLERVGTGAQVAPLLWELQAHPELWDQHTQRIKESDFHAGTNDIWARYAEGGVVVDGPHDSVWYQDVAPILPQVKLLVAGVMTYVGAERLGGVFITQIPPGRNVEPHLDVGWHARFYEKFLVQIQSGPGQKFVVEDEWLETRPGDIYRFDGECEHAAFNPTRYNRITMLISVLRGL
jgi:Aspartyl/Asparaginyl beta-hydroxylase